MPADKYTINYFEAQIEESIQKRRKDSIQRNQEHNEFVCMLANSFYGVDSPLVQKIGFKTILLEPLFDTISYLSGKQSKNFDLLLYNKVTKHLLFLEVKTSFSSIAKVLEDFKKSTEIVKEKFDEKISHRIGLKFSDCNYIDFVLIAPRDQSQLLKERIVSENLNEIIVWDSSPITSSQVEIKHDVPNTTSMISLIQTHIDKSLRDLLYKVLILKKPAKIFNFLLNSDPYEKIIYFVTLFRSFGADEFNYLKIRDSIFCNEHSFFAYENTEEAMIFVYDDLVKNLLEMGCLGIKKNSTNRLEIIYELKIDKRFTEGVLKNSLKKTFFETLIKKNEPIIKQEALDRYNEYHGQETLP